MPYPRLNMSAVNYVKYLQTEPFLGFHAKLLAGNKEALEAAMKIYKQMTATAPNIAQPSEYQRIIDFFGKVPTQVLGVRLCFEFLLIHLLLSSLLLLLFYFINILVLFPAFLLFNPDSSVKLPH